MSQDLASPAPGIGRRPQRTATFDEAFSSSRNSLNFLRLCFAVTVIASHSIGWGGFGVDEVSGRTTWGTLAVYGFFGISGFLIAASAERNTLGRFLWQRCLRIFPGFWVCLIVTAVLFGGIGFLHAPHPPSCHATCYVGNRALPWVMDHWTFRHLTLHPVGLSNPLQWSVPGTRTVFNAQVQNSPLYTLFYEFLCYLMLGLMARVGLLRHRRRVLAVTAGMWTLEVVVALLPHSHLTVDEMLVVVLFPPFLTGTLVHLYRDRLPDSGRLAALIGVVFLASFWLPLGDTTLRPTAVDVFAPLTAYAVLWLGIHLPFHKVGARNDYSYGFYVYGMPVQQLLSFWGLSHHGYALYVLLCVLGTAPFAAASWWLVERRCLRLKKFRLRDLWAVPSRPGEPAVVLGDLAPAQASAASTAAGTPT